MTADDPNARPTRTFAAGEPADPPPDHTRTFSADPSATASFSVSAPPPLAGPVPGWPASLTRYQPLHALGGGGMGLVYLCHDRQLDRQVAVKLSGGGRTADRVDFLLREARSAARLHHPNICPVFDADVCDGVPYLTMAYIDGPTLSDEVKRCGPCPPDAAARLVRTVAEAMQYAHDQGVVHRDLKPSNILLTPEREPIVTDFGLAVRTDQDTTADGTVSGTPHYMAPEQAAGDTANIGPRSDVFALGVILFELLVGRPPFGGSAREVLARVQREAVPPVRAVRQDVPKTLERIVAKATARHPKDRFPHMTAFADALTGFLRQPPAKTGGGLAAGLGKAFLIVAASAAVVFLLIALACGIGLLLPAMQKMSGRGDKTWSVSSAGLTATPPRTTPADREAKRKADAFHSEGMSLLARGKDSEAVVKFDEAIRLDPQAKLSRTLRAVALEKLGLYDNALEDLDVLVKLEPQNVEHYRYRASLRMKTKSSMHHSNAENDLFSAIRLRPDSAPLYVQRAAILLRLGKYEPAKSDCERAVGLAPKDAEARYLRGVAKRKLGDEPGAAADITAAKDLDDTVEHKLRAKGYIE